MTYGLPLEFLTDSGFNVKVVLPVYYADLGRLTSGDMVDFVAKTSLGNVFYQHPEVAIPEKAVILRPVEGEAIDVNENIAVQWNGSVNAEGYVAGYLDASDSDAETTDENAGIYTEYVSASTTEVIVPSTCTKAGSAMFSVDAVSGDVGVFTSKEDPFESFFIVGTSDWVAANITASAIGETLATTDGRGSQGLRIVKEYKKKVEGLRFKIRECDPNQMQAPGTVTVGFKLRRYKASIAFVKLYDMNGNAYASWQKKRIFKSKNKKYYPSFSVKPGTTVVFGSHDASYRGGTYSYQRLTQK